MAAIDLAGIRFRAYLPQFENDIADGDYAPVGPGSASIGSGIDLSAIKFRAWQQNDIASDQASGGDGGGNTGSNPGGVGNISGTVIWPYDEILDNNSVPHATIRIVDAEALIIQQTNIISLSLLEDISNAVPEEETVDNSTIMSITIGETIFSEDTAYGFGNYGEGNYGE